MATLYLRKNKDGSKTYRVQFRRKGNPFLSFAFTTKKEAQAFIKANEIRYIQGLPIDWNSLEERRKREFRIQRTV